MCSGNITNPANILVNKGRLNLVQNEVTPPPADAKPTKRGRFPGLKENIQRLFEDHPNEEFSALAVHQQFPEATRSAIENHMAKFRRIRVIEFGSKSGHYKKASLEHRANTPHPIAARVLKGVQQTAYAMNPEALTRQVQSTVLRMQNRPAMFTELDITSILEALAKVTK